MGIKARTIDRKKGVTRNLQEDGKITYRRKEEMKDVAEAAARGAIQGASGVSGDEQAAADAARQAVEDML